MCRRLLAAAAVGGGGGGDVTIGRSCFTARLHSWGTSYKLNTKFPFQIVYFVGIGGLTASFYSVWGIPLVAVRVLQGVCVCVCMYMYIYIYVCVCLCVYKYIYKIVMHAFIYSIRTFLYSIFINLWCNKYVRYPHHTFLVWSILTDCGILATQTLPLHTKTFL